MRALWIRVLLLAVFFNTVLGVPLHAAEHLHGLPGHAHTHGTEREDATVAHAHTHEHADAHAHGHATDGEAPHGAHGSCTWCSSHAQLAAALLGPAGLALPAAPAAAAPVMQAAEAGHASTPRWRYAARAPPPVQ
ncbi:DUF2946 family protein [Rubrivivax rivuli]|uniref:DUF2946 domain-containing protein n=1 Tax=Rubrivivax rivuli TaxID=1862385 RepID=A0A437RHQ8_9BURK|nr:DUF2946 family protein [Rubrivivax rivuli]RVU46313.1 DUF2946 domain-containing protein [Rubrivivax rivuli]